MSIDINNYILIHVNMLIFIIVDYNVLIDMIAICSLILYHFHNLRSRLVIIIVDGFVEIFIDVVIKVKVRFGLRILFDLCIFILYFLIEIMIDKYHHNNVLIIIHLFIDLPVKSNIQVYF
jgi:hypothetical protein